MGKDRRRIGKREDFEDNEGDNIEEGVPPAQAASEQSIIFATHDPTPSIRNNLSPILVKDG